MTAMVIGDRHTPVEFDGELLCRVSTRSAGKPRWMEISLYRDLVTRDYVVHTIGCSTIYHTADTACRTWGKRVQPGQPATVSDLPDDADPCEDCEPPWPDELGDAEQVRFESPRHTVKRYGSALTLMRKLTRRWDRDAEAWVTQVPAPVAELLEGAAAKDEEIAAIMAKGDDKR